jgi:hypothetical protein
VATGVRGQETKRLEFCSFLLLGLSTGLHSMGRVGQVLKEHQQGASVGREGRSKRGQLCLYITSILLMEPCEKDIFSSILFQPTYAEHLLSLRWRLCAEE